MKRKKEKKTDDECYVREHDSWDCKERDLGKIFRPREEGNVKDPARTSRDFRVYKVELCSVDSFSVALVASYIHIQAPFTSWPYRLTIDIFDTLSQIPILKISSRIFPLFSSKWEEKKNEN